MNYYNEYDAKAAAWLRELIAQGHIAPGVVDERNIKDVRPNDVAGFVQCHFFAGIGVWSYALRRAGVADERHLWPHFFQLIAQRRPPVVLGEQVASKDGLAWFDLVHADLEGAGYSVGAADLCAAGVGAPHIRQRLWFVAHTGRLGGEPSRFDLGAATGRSGGRQGLEGRDPGALGREREAAERGGSAGGLGHAAGGGRGELGHAVGSGRCGYANGAGVAGGLADSDGGHASTEREQRGGEQRLLQADGIGLQAAPAGPGPTNGHWAAADWIFCRDGRWRPVEPCTSPLAHGTPERAGRLRGYGNAVVAEVAQTFIEAYLDIEGETA